MSYPQWLMELRGQATEKFLPSCTEGLEWLYDAIRGHPEYNSEVAQMLEKEGVKALLYRDRHHSSTTVKIAQAKRTYNNDTKVQATRTEKVLGRYKEILNGVVCGGRTLGMMVIGPELEDSAVNDEATANGLLFNAAFKRWCLVNGTAGQTVYDSFKTDPKRLLASWDRLQLQYRIKMAPAESAV